MSKQTDFGLIPHPFPPRSRCVHHRSSYSTGDSTYCGPSVGILRRLSPVAVSLLTGGVIFESGKGNVETHIPLKFSCVRCFVSGGMIFGGSDPVNRSLIPVRIPCSQEVLNLSPLIVPY